MLSEFFFFGPLKSKDVQGYQILKINCILGVPGKLFSTLQQTTLRRIYINKATKLKSKKSPQILKTLNFVNSLTMELCFRTKLPLIERRTNVLDIYAKLDGNAFFYCV